LLGLGALVAQKSIESGKTGDPLFYVGFPIMAGIGVFMALLSYRLILNRAARVGGGLLSPMGWKVVGVFFAGTAIMLSTAAVWHGQLQVFISAVPAVVFAVMCFAAANRYSSRP
jgi:hypothetical protein